MYNKDFVKARGEKVKDVIPKLELNLKGEYMAELKTKANQASVEDFLNSIPDEKKTQGRFCGARAYAGSH